MNAKKKNIIIGSIITLIVIVLLGVLCLFLFKKEKFEVSLKIDDSILETSMVIKGNTFEEPENPTKEGYTFLGWYVGEEKFDFSKEITENVTLEARWEKRTYKVTFIDGTEKKESFVTYHEKVSKPENPVKKGYIFLGWYTQDTAFDFDTLIDQDITLEAKWGEDKKVTLKVEHYLMDTNGTYSKNPYQTDIITQDYGTVVTPKVKTYEGFISPEVKTITLQKNENQVIRYYYVRKKYKVTVEKGLGVISVNGNGEYYYGANVTVKADVSMGYHFESWSQQSKDMNYTFTMPSENVSLTALASPNTETPYKVRTYYMDMTGNYKDYEEENYVGVTDTNINLSPKEVYGFTLDKKSDQKILGDGSTIIEIYYKRNKFVVTAEKTEGIKDVTKSQEYYYKSKVKLNATLEEGYDFVGWFVQDKKVSSDMSYEFTVDENVTVSAQAKKKEFVIDFMNEGTKVSSITKKYGETLTEEEYPKISKEYYTLTWMKGLNEFDKETLIKENITLEAHFDVSSYTIVFYDEDKLYKGVVQEEGENVEVPESPSKENYQFVGWFTKDGKLYDFELNPIIPKEGIELYSKYVKIVNIDDFILMSIMDSNTFETTFDNNEIHVKLINASKKIQETSLKENNEKVFAEGFVKEVIVIYNNKEYTITKDNYDSFLESFTNTSLEKYEDRMVNSFNQKSLQVKIVLDDQTAISNTGDFEKEYTIDFTSNKILEKESFIDFGKHWLNEIEKNTVKNNYQKYHIEVNGNEILLITKEKQNSVLGTVAGSGVKTTMQKLLGLEYVKSMTLYFANMDPVIIESENITDENFEDFGLSILPYFAKAVNKSYWEAFGIRNYELEPLEVKCELTLKDGLSFDDSIPLTYYIHFKVDETIGNKVN